MSITMNSQLGTDVVVGTRKEIFAALKELPDARRIVRAFYSKFNSQELARRVPKCRLNDIGSEICQLSCDIYDNVDADRRDEARKFMEERIAALAPAAKRECVKFLLLPDGQFSFATVNEKQ